MNKFLTKLTKPVNRLFPMKEQKILFLISLAIIPIVIFLAYEDSFAKMCMYDNSCTAQNLGLNFFYRDLQQIGFNLMFVFVLLLLIPNLYSYQTIKEKNNLFNMMIIQRISYKKYMKREIRNNFVKTFLVVMIIYVYSLFITNLFVPIEFNFSAIDWNYVYNPYYQQYYELFSNNSFISTIIYIIFVSLGYAVFSNFILSLQAFLKNLYIYRITGILTLILCVSGMSVLTTLFANIIGMKNASLLFSPFVIGFLLNPGMMTFGGEVTIPSMTWYFISTLTFLIISYILFKVSEKRWMKENV